MEIVEDRRLLSDVAGLNSGNEVSSHLTYSNTENGGYVDLPDIRFDYYVPLGINLEINVRFDLLQDVGEFLQAAGLSPEAIYGFANGQFVGERVHALDANDALRVVTNLRSTTAQDLDGQPHFEVRRPEATMISELPMASLPETELASARTGPRDSSETSPEMADVERVARAPVLATVQQLAAISREPDVPAGLINLSHLLGRPAATVLKSPPRQTSLRGRAGASQSFEVAVHSAPSSTSPIVRSGALVAEAAADQLPLDGTVRPASLFAALPAAALPGEAAWAEQRQQEQAERPADLTPGEGGERLPEEAGFALAIRKAARAGRDAIFADGGFLNNLLQPETAILLTALTAQLLVEPRRDDKEEKKNLRDALRWRRRFGAGQR